LDHVDDNVEVRFQQHHTHVAATDFSNIKHTGSTSVTPYTQVATTGIRFQQHCTHTLQQQASDFSNIEHILQQHANRHQKKEG